MKKAKLHFLFCSACVLINLTFLPFQVNAQGMDSVLLLNGETIKGRISEDLGDFYRFEWSRGESVKSIAIEKIDIFSIYYQGQGETIIYQQDTVAGNDFTVDQMRDFLEGEKQARKDYRPKFPVVGGVIVGAVAVYTGFWGIALAPVYLGVLSTGKPMPAKGTLPPSQVKDAEFYNLGYGYAARRKKVQRSALATLGGLVTVWAIKVATDGLK